MAFIAGNAAITAIQNVALVTRYDQLAVPLSVLVDGATFTADGVLQRGTLLVLNAGSGKWHPAVHGTDTIVADQVRIMQDDMKVASGVDLMCSAYSEGFFRLSSLVDANPGLVIGDIPASVGFHPAGSDEVRLK
jgi:hypothetical protein